MAFLEGATQQSQFSSFLNTKNNGSHAPPPPLPPLTEPEQYVCWLYAQQLTARNPRIRSN